ncbi:SEC-C metal-binding domain-containing protein [Erythrobacter sp. SDW2]|uniref:SEC-C metal-binding domain-containing protein n=1 Tax=Erythrobacter sp. SDW2 TaxID=2907154 RepID=UPI00351D2DC4
MRQERRRGFELDQVWVGLRPCLRPSGALGAPPSAKRRRRPCQSITTTMPSPAFERTSKRRKGFPSETKVKRGVRSIKGGAIELLEKLGREDPCPCGSGKRFQALLPALGPVSTGPSGGITGGENRARRAHPPAPPASGKGEDCANIDATELQRPPPACGRG